MKRILLFFLLAAPLFLYADKYEDLLLKMRGESHNVAFYNYQKYQTLNPRQANVYFQMATISFDFLKNTNPILDVKAFKNYAYNARLYYGSCRHEATDAEVRKYADFYYGVNFGEKPNVDVLTAFVNAKLDSVADIAKRGSALNEAFTKLSSQYERCVQLFLGFNQKYSSINEALLEVDAIDIQNLEAIREISDSMNLFVQNYSMALKNFPVDGLNPQFEVLPIELFRIDALCSVNFLVNSVVLYDFSNWVDRFVARRDNHVLPLMNSASNICGSLIADNSLQAPISLLNSLRQLDSLSYPAAVIQIYNARNFVNSNIDKIASLDDATKTLSLLYEMKLTINAADEQLNMLKKIGEADMQRYQAFSTEFFYMNSPAEALSPVVTSIYNLYNNALLSYRRFASSIVLPLKEGDVTSISIGSEKGELAAIKYKDGATFNNLSLSNIASKPASTRLLIEGCPIGLSYSQSENSLLLSHNILNSADLDAPYTQLSLYNIDDKSNQTIAKLPIQYQVLSTFVNYAGYQVFAIDNSGDWLTVFYLDKLGTVKKSSKIAIPQNYSVYEIAQCSADLFVIYILNGDSAMLLNTSF